MSSRNTSSRRSQRRLGDMTSCEEGTTASSRSADTSNGSGSNDELYDDSLDADSTKSNADPSDDFIFSDPIFVNQDEAFVKDRRCFMKLTVVIIFNLGLTHHLRSGAQAPSDSSRRTSDLTKALALYELSCRTQILEDVVLNELYTMAHFNNLGVVHAALGNVDMAIKCFRRLLKGLVLHKECTTEEDINSQELEGFYQNSMGLILQDPAVAPAA
jgi:hypothetical protein